MNGKIFLGIVLILSFLLWCSIRIDKSVVFDIDCGGHLKRAADANTIELAHQEMVTAVSFLEENNITSGYTSVLYRTPDEDIGFWYKNLKASLGELETVKPDATQLEKSNILMKLRETLLDSGEKSVYVTMPDGISIYPSNGAYFIFGIITGVLCIVGVVLVAIGRGEH